MSAFVWQGERTLHDSNRSESQDRHATSYVDPAPDDLAETYPSLLAITKPIIMSDQRPSHIEIPSSGMNGTTVENAKADVEMQDGGASPVRDEHEVNRRRAPNGPFTPLGDPSFKRESPHLDLVDTRSSSPY
mgnify:CR=1 FL=1